MTKISIITPSYNQGQFIERTINSVLNQNIGNIEYLVVDGASNDNTVSILEKYSDKIRWISEIDDGQTDAINKGLQMTSGDIIGWLNSDDVYQPDALTRIQACFNRYPEIDVIYGEAQHIDEFDQIIEPYYTEEWNIERLKDVCYLCQPAVFFRRRVVEQYGMLDKTLNYCMDYEYWLRLGLRGARFYHLKSNLAGSRLHPDTKTLGDRIKVHKEINYMLRKHLGKVPDRWLSNYAHAVVEAKLPRTTKKFNRVVAFRTLITSFKWNKKISLPLLNTLFQWVTN